MTFTRQDIDAEYHRLGYQRGWSFMACPEARLRDARVAIVGLNPGGGGPGDNYQYQGLWDEPAGNCYYRERWGPGGQPTPLQRQIWAWHDELGLGPDDSFCAQFVPFRSPDWRRLERKPEAVHFGERLWRWVLSVSPAEILVTMGKLPAAYLAEATTATRWASRLPTGWGRQGIDVYDTADGRRIVAMPHPGRYGLFGRGEASETARTSFRAATGLEA